MALSLRVFIVPSTGPIGIPLLPAERIELRMSKDKEMQEFHAKPRSRSALMKSVSPKRLRPMEAQLVLHLPEGGEWQFEPKWDGFRCLAFRKGNDVQLI